MPAVQSARAETDAYVVLRLTPWDCVGLWWQGRSDARRRIPRLGTEAGPYLELPQVEVIRRSAHEVCESERLRLFADLSRLSARGLEAQARSVAAEAALIRAERALSELEAQPWSAEVRRHGEEPLEPWLVARRRQREHERLLAQRRQEVDGLKEAAQRASAEVETVAEQTAERHHHARVRVQRYVQHAERRMALYWRALLRRHQGAQPLSEQWRLPRVAVPAWAADEELA